MKTMPFDYEIAPIARKHGPSGYDDYKSYKSWLRDEFTFRCVYCLERERWYPNGHASFGVDHVFPQGRPEYEHLICRYSNLVYACNRCNSAKRDRILINPDEYAFAQHLRIEEDGEIVGLSVEGWDIINILGLNLLLPTNTRRAKLKILRLYSRWPNNPEVKHLYFDAFGYPDDLPDLAVHTRSHNSNPESILQSYHRQREMGTLPPTYG